MYQVPIFYCCIHCGPIHDSLTEAEIAAQRAAGAHEQRTDISFPAVCASCGYDEEAERVPVEAYDVRDLEGRYGVLKYLRFRHVRNARIRNTSMLFADLGYNVAIEAMKGKGLDPAETHAALRKIREAKDCIVGAEFAREFARVDPGATHASDLMDAPAVPIRVFTEASPEAAGAGGLANLERALKSVALGATDQISLALWREEGSGSLGANLAVVPGMSWDWDTLLLEAGAVLGEEDRGGDQ